MIENLPRNLLLLDHNELRDARRDRDERMSLLFRSWPSLTKVELRELRKLSDERQRLARHVGTLRSLRALRGSKTRAPEIRLPA
ncbi:MAG: hypothetical protein ACRDQT_00360 [Gaiellaceae bacterium]